MNSGNYHKATTKVSRLQIRVILSIKRKSNGKLVEYANFVCDYYPLKTKTNKINLVADGYELGYDVDAGTPAALLIETKLLINGMISEMKHGATFLSYDLRDFFCYTHAHSEGEGNAFFLSYLEYIIII